MQSGGSQRREEEEEIYRRAVPANGHGQDLLFFRLFSFQVFFFLCSVDRY
jgi:hypothetical protein